MTEPGWYHGDGDPVGTVRYWDGNTWAGEPTMTAADTGSVAVETVAAPTTETAANGIVYYAAPEHERIVAGSLAAEHDISAVTYRATAKVDPVQAAPAPPVPTPAIPASAQLIAIGLSVLKTVPLLFLMLNTLLVAVFGTVGLTLAYNEDVETLLALAIGMSLLYIAIGILLLGSQALGAARNKPGLLLVPALVMTGWDGLLTAGAWTNAHGTDHFFYTGLFLAQAWVLIGAVIGLFKRTI